MAREFSSTVLLPHRNEPPHHYNLQSARWHVSEPTPPPTLNTKRIFSIMLSSFRRPFATLSLLSGGKITKLVAGTECNSLRVNAKTSHAQPTQGITASGACFKAITEHIRHHGCATGQQHGWNLRGEAELVWWSSHRKIGKIANYCAKLR